MAIETTWRSVIDTDICYQTDHIPLLQSNIGKVTQLITLTIYSHIGVGGFNTRSECCTRSCRVGYEVCGRIVRYKVASIELRKVQTQGFACTRLRRVVLLGSKNLIEAHTISDKVEHIFRFLGRCRDYIGDKQNAKTQRYNRKCKSENQFCLLLHNILVYLF